MKPLAFAATACIALCMCLAASPFSAPSLAAELIQVVNPAGGDTYGYGITSSGVIVGNRYGVGPGAQPVAYI